MERPRDLRWARIACFLLWLGYGAAFYLPVLPGHDSHGWDAFEAGFFVLLPPWHLHEPGMAQMLVSWLANPLFWFGLLQLLRGRWRRASVAGLAAFLAGSVWLLGNGTGNLPRDLRAGYYVWWASMGLLSGTGWFFLWRHKRATHQWSLKAEGKEP